MGSQRSKEKLSLPMVVWEVKGQMLFFQANRLQNYCPLTSIKSLNFYKFPNY